jgi:predicted ester cyclase
MSARAVAQEFFDHREAGEVEHIIGMTAPGAIVSLVPLGVRGSMAEEGASYLRDLTRAFPDLLVRVRRLFVTTDNTAVAEITTDGTQAADFLGVTNQEKHFDLDQGWLLEVTSEDMIGGETAYWDQNQLYRRLGVNRLDNISITAR